MIIDTDKLLQQCREAQAKTGEEYFSFRMEVTLYTRPGSKDEIIFFSAYTPNTNHSINHKTPEAALADTVMAASDPGKLAQQAEVYENEARKLRARIGGQS